jgi:glycosyltransferase involved in cell wall biosynthesis
VKSIQARTVAASTSNDRISVIIPTQNSAKALERCLQSIEAQTRPVGEIVVVDGFSNDNTREIASQAGTKVMLASGTQAAARNVGLSSSNSEYVLFLDSDQELESTVVEECLSICAEEKADAVKIPEFFVGENFWGKCSAFWKTSMGRTWGSEGGIPRFYRRSILAQSSAYDSRLRFWEDLELYQRLRLLGLRREAWCRGRVIHHESSSLRDMVKKYFCYGRSVAAFKNSSTETPYRLTLRLTLSTAMGVLKNPCGSPLIFFGSLFQASLKGLCAVLGVLAG